MKFRVTNIIWETDGYKVKLPKTVTVEAEDEDEALDAVSDEYGWLVQSCTIEEMH